MAGIWIPPPRRWWIADLTIPVLLFGVGLTWVLPFAVDDSYISMRYASNLASGHGLVFNPGEAPLEGYTNFLLVLVESALIRAGMVTLAPVKALLAISGLALIFTVAAYGRLRLVDGTAGAPLRWLPGLAALLVATSSPVLLWTASALETVLFALLVTAAAIGYALFLIERLSGPKLLLAELLWVLAILARPEGLLFWGLTVGHTVLLSLFRRDRKVLQVRLPGILLGALSIAAYGAWKLAYFGDLLPATYWAKAKPMDASTFLGGGVRFLGFLSINGNFFIALILVAGAVMAWRHRVEIRSPLWYLAVLAAGYAVYVLSLGSRTAMDDAYRFYVPLVPLASLLLIELGATLRPAVRDIRVAVTASVVAVAFLIPLRAHDLWHAWRIDLNWGMLHYRIPGRDVARGLERGHVALGRWLRDHAPRDATVVLHDAGAIPYFSGLNAIDTWSLTDPVLIGHRRALSSAEGPAERERIFERMRAHVISRNPDYIVQDGLGLLEDPEIRARYRPTGDTFVYLDAYPCGRREVCRYVLEPHVRKAAADDTT